VKIEESVGLIFHDAIWLVALGQNHSPSTRCSCIKKRVALRMSSTLRQHLPQESLLEASPSPLASRGAEALRLGDFKQAIELFRRLVKQDGRPEWRVALADAYAGRARILAAKGMFEEAEVALSKTAAPDGMVRDPLLYVKCLVKLGRAQKAAEFAVRCIGNHQVPAASASQLAELAAALWLTTPARLALPVDRQSEKDKWGEHAATAQQSLTAWIEGKPPHRGRRDGGKVPLGAPCGETERSPSDRRVVWRLPLTAFLAGDRREENSWGAF
jgi:hypothetical protein